MKAIQKTIIPVAAALVGAIACVSLLCASQAQAMSTWDTPDAAPQQQQQPRRLHPDERPYDTADTTVHWDKARQYQRQQRFELARQHYLLALATCRTEETRDRLQRELQIIDLQLRTMR